MAKHSLGRWDGPVHFYEYTPDYAPRYDQMDAFTVAEAYIYNPAGTASLRIVFVVTGQDLKAAVTLDKAITTAREHLQKFTQNLPGTPYEEAKTLKANKTFLFTWRAQLLQEIG